VIVTPLVSCPVEAYPVMEITDPLRAPESVPL